MAVDRASMIVLRVAVIAALMSLVPGVVGAQQDLPEDRAITLLGGGVYQLRFDKAYTVFLVTPDGVVLVDPLSPRAARWLENELSRRFADVRVKYVVFTDHHADRASSGGVFGRSATLVAQQEFRAAVDQARNKNSHTYRYVPSVRTTFAKQRTIELGGTSVDVVHVGPFHSPELSVVRFPSQRLVFAAHRPPIHTTNLVADVERPVDAVRWLEEVAKLDFDTILFDDGTTMTRQALVSLAGYWSRLYGAVRSGFVRGESVERLQNTVLLEPYRSLPQYARRSDQIAEIYDRLHFFRVDVMFSGVATYMPENPAEYCQGYISCSAGGAIGGGSAAAAASIGHWFGFQVEGTFGDQFWNTRSRSQYDEEVAFRPTRVALLARINTTRSGGLALLAGSSSTTGDVQGLDRVPGRLVPVGGRHAIRQNRKQRGLTGGVDLSMRLGALRLVMPVRATMLFDRPALWPSKYDFSAGIGIALPLFRNFE